MKIIKAIGNIAGYTVVALAICGGLLFVTVEGFALTNRIKEGCTTERSSETMNLVTCKSGVHYETR